MLQNQLRPMIKKIRKELKIRGHRLLGTYIEVISLKETLGYEIYLQFKTIKLNGIQFSTNFAVGAIFGYGPFVSHEIRRELYKVFGERLGRILILSEPEMPLI